MLKDSDLSPFQPIPKPKTDSLTYIVRFVCGAIMGFIMGCIASVYAIFIIFRHNRILDFAAIEKGTILEYETLLYTVCGIAILLFILVFGLGAMIFGDRFWR